MLTTTEYGGKSNIHPKQIKLTSVSSGSGGPLSLELPPVDMLVIDVVPTTGDIVFSIGNENIYTESFVGRRLVVQKTQTTGPTYKIYLEIPSPRVFTGGSSILELDDGLDVLFLDFPHSPSLPVPVLRSSTGSGGAVDTIYNADGILPSNRTVDLDSHLLNFTGGNFSTVGAGATIMGGTLLTPNLSLAPTVGTARDNVIAHDVSTKQLYYTPNESIYRDDGTLADHRTVSIEDKSIVFQGTSDVTSLFQVSGAEVRMQADSNGATYSSLGTQNLTSTGLTTITGDGVHIDPGFGGQIHIREVIESFNYASYKIMVQRSSGLDAGRVHNFQAPGFAAHLALDTVITTVGPHYMSGFAISQPGEYIVKGLLDVFTGVISAEVTGHYLICFECTTQRAGGASFLGSFVLERSDGVVMNFGFTNTCTSNDISSKACSGIVALDAANTGRTYRIRVDLSAAATVTIFAPDNTATPKIAGTRLSCKLLF